MRASRRQFISLAATTPAALALGGCAWGVADKGPIADRLIDAVATTGMIGDLVTNVGRERVDLSVLMGAGVDPHLFKASERTLRTMERSDCIFYNGLHLEGGLAYVLEQMGEDQPTVPCAEVIPTDLLLTPPEFEGAYDPHVWFDISLWQLALQGAIAGMQALDPTWAESYAANGERYLAELATLEEWVFAQVATVPEERRVLITAHDAFGYFGRRYGFEVRGIQGASTSTEAGARDLQNLAELIVARQIPAIFVESSVPRRTVEALREAVQARGFDVRIGGQLFSDAMGDRDTIEGTYIGMFQANVTTIVDALLGRNLEE